MDIRKFKFILKILERFTEKYTKVLCYIVNSLSQISNFLTNLNRNRHFLVFYVKEYKNKQII